MPLPIIGDLLDLFPDTIEVRRALTFDGYGNVATFGPVETFPANIIGRTMTVLDKSGIEQTSTRHVIIGAPANTSVRDEFTLPARFDPRVKPAISIRYATDENGAHHETVFF